MKQAFSLLRNPYSPWPSLPLPLPLPLPLSPPSPSPSFLLRNKTKKPISATLESPNGEQLTAKERRQMRNERREGNTTNWREEVEERLLKKTKKRYANWKEELNLDNLAELGPQWWGVRVSRVNGQETAALLARYLVRNFPDFDFKVYAPAVHVKRKLKNGTVSVKPKPIFPGCVFLRCVLNKELHDTIRECPGIGGFIGSKVGNTKRQINRPKPVSPADIEAIFRQAKEEQEKADQGFEEEQQSEEIVKVDEMNVNSAINVVSSITDPKPKRRSKKASEPVASSPPAVANDKLLVPGSSVRVVSGSFTEFKGSLKKLDSMSGMATVAFMLFGKESLVDVDASQIVVET